MQRVSAGPLAGGAFRDVLVCPVGHKYEILLAQVSASPTAISACFNQIVPAAGGYAGTLSDGKAPPAASFNILLPWVPAVLYGGDKIQVFVNPAGDSFYFVATYMDVDFDG